MHEDALNVNASCVNTAEPADLHTSVLYTFEIVVLCAIIVQFIHLGS